jgi:hypothetical protein
MPGDFIQEVHIFRCGTHSDGSAIFCSEIGWVKDLFPAALKAEDSSRVGWQQADDTDIHISLTRLVEAMKQAGITVSYDEYALTRRLGPPPES